MAMPPADLSLPAGTAVLLFPDMVLLELRWQGKAGRHVVRLNQALPREEIPDRAEAFAHAIELFRNVVGLEVIDDALQATGSLPTPTHVPPGIQSLHDGLRTRMTGNSVD